ncbi:MAG: hypothetical protein EOP02_06875 [Proteobacteria bacterium]|nr:MAG: hypothetical protein EOP02_06875 [Pseudomonadota bacterium]
MARTMDAYRADLIAEQLGGWISRAERHTRELVESNRRAFLATGDVLHVWGGMVMRLRPSDWPPDHYRSPLAAPDPVPPLPGWIAEYLYRTARRLLVLLVQLVPPVHARDAGLDWCRHHFETTGEELYLWVAVLLLQPQAGTVLPAWMAVALFRVARDLDDQMAGRDLAQRPPVDKEWELLAWQKESDPPRIPRADAEDLLPTFGFPHSPGQGAFKRVHRQMAVAKGFPFGLQLSRVAPLVSRKEIFAAFGFLTRPGFNPSAGMRERMRDKDALYAFRRAGKGAGLEAAKASLGVREQRVVERRLSRARRLDLGLPERNS